MKLILEHLNAAKITCTFCHQPYMGSIGILVMLSWMFQHDCLDTYCFECLICMYLYVSYMYFVFLYLDLFSTIEHVSHGKAL